MTNVFQQNLLQEERDEARSLLEDQLIQNGFLIDQMKREQQVLSERNQKLQAQIDRLAYMCRRINERL